MVISSPVPPLTPYVCGSHFDCRGSGVADDAISSGHGAYLVEKVQGVGYRMSIGNLPAGQTATSTPPTLCTAARWWLW
jgi:hypothetical protein